MVDILTNLVPLFGAGILGAVLKLMGNAQKAKADYNKNMFKAFNASQDSVNNSNEQANKSKGFAMTRRFIVVAVTSIVVASFWVTNINVPIEVTTGASYLWGIIDTTLTNTVYVPLSGHTVLPVIMPSFQAIVGLYMGSSIVGSVR